MTKLLPSAPPCLTSTREGDIALPLTGIAPTTDMTTMHDASTSMTGGLAGDGLEIDVRHGDGMTVVAASGHLCRETATRLSCAVSASVPGPDEMLVVDLGGVSYLDTVGLGICMSSANAARSEGRCVIVLPPAGDSAQAIAGAAA